MKKAKVDKGVITHVWPKVKTLADGTVAVKECPYGRGGKHFPDCIIDVEDHVKPGFVWNGMEYAPKPKKVIQPRRSDLWEVLSEKLGISHDDLVAEVKARKKARLAAKKT